MNTAILWVLLATSYDGGMMPPMYFKQESECRKVASSIPGRYISSRCVQAEVIVTN